VVGLEWGWGSSDGGGGGDLKEKRIIFSTYY
jgi:hypothetical protein